jgi:hypothetical protein
MRKGEQHSVVKRKMKKLFHPGLMAEMLMFYRFQVTTISYLSVHNSVTLLMMERWLPSLTLPLVGEIFNNVEQPL